MRPATVLTVPGTPYLIGTRWWPSDRPSRLRRVADILGLSRAARGRLEWFLWREANQATVAATCRRFGTTPKTYHKWAQRFDEANLRTLEDRPKTTHRKRQKEYTPEQYERVVALRRAHIRYSKVKLLVLYRSAYPDDRTISNWKVQCIVQRSGLYYHPAKQARINRKRCRSVRRKKITDLALRKRTGFLFCLDTVVRYWLGQKRYVFTAVDRYAKLAFARMYPTKSSTNAAEFLARLRLLTNGRIENIGHDNGSEFQGEFAKSCARLGIPQYHSRIKTPKDNAVNERFNRTLEEEFIQMGNMTADTATFNQKLTEWLIEYNFRRPHQTLGYMSPINFIYRHHHLLPMTPSSTAS